MIIMWEKPQPFFVTDFYENCPFLDCTPSLAWEVETFWAVHILYNILSIYGKL
jgi:hypothetical protein